MQGCKPSSREAGCIPNYAHLWYMKKTVMLEPDNLAIPGQRLLWACWLSIWSMKFPARGYQPPETLQSKLHMLYTSTCSSMYRLYRWLCFTCHSQAQTTPTWCNSTSALPRTGNCSYLYLSHPHACTHTLHIHVHVRVPVHVRIYTMHAYIHTFMIVYMWCMIEICVLNFQLPDPFLTSSPERYTYTCVVHVTCK